VTAQTIALATSSNSTGTLNITGTASNPLTAGTILFGSGNATLNLEQSSQSTATIASSLSSQLKGSGVVNQLSGSSILKGNSSGFTGQMNVSSGSSVQFGDGSTSGTSLGAATINNGGTLAFDLAKTGVTAFGGSISGGGILNQSGSLLALTGDNSAFTGKVNIASGSTLQLGTGVGSTGNLSGATAINNNGSFALNVGTATTVSGQISGTGSLNQSGPAQATLTAAETYTGATTVNGSALSLGTTGTIRRSAVTVQNGGTLLLGSTDANVQQVSTVSMVNGTLSLGAQASTPTATPQRADNQVINSLTLTGTSVIDFAALGGGSTLTINTMTMATGSTLNVFDWNGTNLYGTTSTTGGGATHLDVNSGNNGINLSQINFYGGNSTTSSFLGNGQFVGNEIVPVPEPGVIVAALMLLGALLFSSRGALLGMLRRRSA
jgi:autotransporter-associated beta strand protein